MIAHMSDHADDAVCSLAEAAEITGLSTDALRLRWRRGTLSGYKSGRRLLLCRGRLPRGHRSESRTGDHFSSVGSERDRSEIALLRRQLQVKDQQIAELHVLLGRLALPAPEASAPRRSWWRFWKG
jgi:hypothetical protein